MLSEEELSVLKASIRELVELAYMMEMNGQDGSPYEERARLLSWRIANER